jgi:replicative DNA helicase
MPLPRTAPHTAPPTAPLDGPVPSDAPDTFPAFDDNAPSSPGLPTDWDERAPPADGEDAASLGAADWDDPDPAPRRYTLPALDCEGAVLGAVLLRNERYWQCQADGLRAEHFESELHARLWLLIGDMLQAGIEVTPLTLMPKLAGDSQFLSVGGHRYFGRLAVSAAGLLDVVPYGRIVRDWSDRRLLARLAGHVEAEALHGQNTVQDLCAEIEDGVAQCRLTARADGPKSLLVAATAAQEAHDRAAERGAVDGRPFGLRALDAVTGGAGRSDLVILAGRPGMGKSALAMHVALHNARAGHGVALFSLEMSAEQVASRIVGQAIGLGADRLRRGETNAGQRAAAHAALGTLDLPLMIDDRGGLTVGDIRARTKRMMAQTKIDLLVIDYLQLIAADMRSAGRSDNRVQQLTAITAGLKELAKEFAVPVIALSQLNRGVEARDDKRPQLADLRDSGSIEQDADTVVFLYREHYYLQRQEPRGATADTHADWLECTTRLRDVAELIVAKNRHGPCNTVVVGFDAPLMRFYDRDATGWDGGR